MYGKARAIADSRFQGGPIDQLPPLGRSFLEQAPEEAARFSRVYHELTIAGGSMWERFEPMLLAGTG